MSELYELTLVSEIQGQECLNRWNYITDVPVSGHQGAFRLLSAFGAVYDSGADAYPSDTLLAKLVTMTTSDVTYKFASARNIYSNVDFYEVPFSQSVLVGFQGNPSLGPAAAFGFRTTRVRTDIARGTKRFVGVAENFVTGGLIETSGTPADVVEAVRAALSGTLEALDGTTVLQTFQPVICKKEGYSVDHGANPPTRAYKYFDDKATQISESAVGFVYETYRRIRTQRSRQPKGL